MYAVLKLFLQCIPLYSKCHTSDICIAEQGKASAGHINTSFQGFIGMRMFYHYWCKHRLLFLSVILFLARTFILA